MDENNQLVPSDLATTKQCSMQCLEVELAITSSTTKIKLDPLATVEFQRVLIEERLQPAEAIQWAFRRWRDESEFFPAPANILKLIKLWQSEQRAQREEQERKENREANCMGLEQLRDILGTLVKKKPSTPSLYTPLSPDELKRRRDEQLKAVREKYGERKQDNAPGNDSGIGS